MALLEVKDLAVSYGAIKAVKGISFHVDEGEIVTLIGANGAGKTTTMNTLAGLVKPAAGSITFKGEDITHARPAQIVKKGICLSPEGRQIFPGLSVLENLEMGAYTVTKEAKARGIEQAFTLFPRLKERASQAGGTLSGWRAADARSCPCFDGRTQTVNARRTFLGSLRRLSYRKFSL